MPPKVPHVHSSGVKVRCFAFKEQLGNSEWQHVPGCESISLHPAYLPAYILHKDLRSSCAKLTVILIRIIGRCFMNSVSTCPLIIVESLLSYSPTNIFCDYMTNNSFHAVWSWTCTALSHTVRDCSKPVVTEQAYWKNSKAYMYALVAVRLGVRFLLRHITLF